MVKTAGVLAGAGLAMRSRIVLACVKGFDNKTVTQELGRAAATVARSRPTFPVMPGVPVKRTHDYVRLPDDLDVHLICDNYSTHKHPTVTKWLAAHPRIHMHVTPTYASWINQIERLFAYLTADLLQRSDHRSVQPLEADIRNCVKTWNEDPTPFMDQERRADPHLTRTTSQTNYRRGTLVRDSVGFVSHSRHVPRAHERTLHAADSTSWRPRQNFQKMAEERIPPVRFVLHPMSGAFWMRTAKKAHCRDQRPTRLNATRLA